MKLSKPIPTIFFISICILFVGVLVFSISINNLLKEQTISFYEREAKLLTSLIEKSLYQSYLDAKFLPLFLGEIDQTSFNTKVISELFQQELNNLAKSRNTLTKIAVLDLQGKILVENTENYNSISILPSNIDQVTIANSQWFKAIKNHKNNRSNQVYLFGPQRSFIDKYENRFDLLIGTPLLSTEGEMIGIWVNIIDFYVVEEVFKSIYNQLAKKDLHHVELSLIDAKGVLIVEYDPIGFKQSKYVRNFDRISKTNLVKEGVIGADRAIAGFSGTEISSHDQKDEQQITIYNHFEGYNELQGIGWSTLVRIDHDEAFSASVVMIQNASIFLFFLFIVFFILMNSVFKNLLNPLNELSNFISDLATDSSTSINSKYISADLHVALKELESKFIERTKLINKNVEQRELLELQRSAINSTSTGIVVSDVRLPDQPIIFINRAFTQITGYRPEEVLGKNCRFLQGAKTEKDKVKHLAHAINKGVSCNVVITNYTKTGETFINNLSIGPVYNKNKELTHFIGVQNDITEDKRKEEETMTEMSLILEERTKESKDSADRLRAVFDAALDGTIVLNQNGIIQDANRSLELIFGRNRNDLLDKNINILLAGLQPTQLEQANNIPFNSWIKDYIGEPKKLFGLHKAGHQIPIEMSVGETTLDAKAMYVAIIRDISFQEQIKQRELALQTKLYEQELIYRTAFNQAAVGIGRIGVDTKFVEVNTKMCEILGYDEDTLLSKSIKDVTYKDDLEQSYQYIKQLLADEITYFNTDKRYIRNDGSFFWANLSVSLVRDADSNEPKFFIAVVEDITERQQSAEELHRANSERDKLLSGLNLASEAGGVCNWSFDIKTGQLNWDSRMYRLYGVEDGKSIEYNDWRDNVHPDDVEQAEQEVSDAISNITSLKTEFRIINRKDKTIHWLQCAANLSLDENNLPVTMYGINVDLTHEKQVQQKLEKETESARQASKAKSRFLATMSHEIRTPMNGVIGMIDLLKNTPLNADQKRMATTIRDSSFSLLDIINDILDFSKIESGQIELDINPCNVLSIIEKTIDSLWINASNNNVEIYIYPDLSIPKELLFDSVRLRQIILNLTGNAVKFSKSLNSKGVVVIRTQLTNENLILEVIDNGVGISQSQQETLFVPFTQADTSTTRKFGGTGLGLSITKSFTELMNGNIDIESEVGQGSNFTVTLPSIEKLTQLDNGAFSQFDFKKFNVLVSISNEERKHACLMILNQLCCNRVSSVEFDELESLAQGTSNALLITDNNSVSFTEISQSIKTLILNDDPIATKGHLDPYTYVCAAHPYKPTEFIFGMAVLCGLESPALDWSTENSQSFEKVITQTIEEAEQTNSLILVAEDQPTNRLVLGKQLESLGYAYEMSNDGVEALEKWQSGRFNLLLTDCHMPNMDGLELTRTIREQELKQNCSPITIIAVTANAMVGESENCLEAGMDDYLAKPIEIELLQEKLVQYLPLTGIHQQPESVSYSMTNGVEQHNNAIDFEKLKAVIGTDDESITNEILAMFWTSVNEDYEALKQHCAERNSEIIRSKSHAAKGASVSSGAIELSDIFKWIEKNNTDFDGIESKYPEIDKELNAINQILKQREVV
ncbi:hypothetical protein A9267_02185 [Shewanella sp. UCD-FRSSP16_17]|uniref:PAS domain-containing hybrid sensor histidine kinase/response regulator n=1 Tax=Shewanella sp. UCD-FRSSP16_17 TaxID=1853256 RepID=UPI0007EEC152|nr:PAS domain S-box protein [Shewanella sp. UCD-FRSSP16_17]OBT11471.1 hypothetical protein A9267_02185 [Shewanella sp. UCD-FRSSP16_17]